MRCIVAYQVIRILKNKEMLLYQACFIYINSREIALTHKQAQLLPCFLKIAKPIESFVKNVKIQITDKNVDKIFG